MKTELQIAEENVKLSENHNLDKDIQDNICITHKASCERFLEWLNSNLWDMNDLHQVEDMTEDLKQAIKFIDLVKI